jgi:chorismate-pyruvate lyase
MACVRGPDAHVTIHEGLMLGRKGAAISAGELPARQSPPSPATRQAQAFALLQTLNARLLASHSATSTLEEWCVGHASAGDAVIRARRVAGVDKPASVEQRERLEVARRERVVYRRVELACGERVLSEAENWYVPGRLTAEIRKVLAKSDTPFGRAVMDLNPVRDTFAVEVFWRPEDAPGAGFDQPDAERAIPWRLFQHRALVYGENRRPFSEVNETYTREILAFGPPALNSR